MILLLFLLIKRNYCFRLAQIFGWRRSKYSIFSVYFLKTFANFLHWDTQLSWQFHIFGWDTQFWYTKIGNFHDNFMFLVKWCHFYTTEMCKFSDFKTLTRHTVQRYVRVDNPASDFIMSMFAAIKSATTQFAVSSPRILEISNPWQFQYIWHSDSNKRHLHWTDLFFQFRYIRSGLYSTFSPPWICCVWL